MYQKAAMIRWMCQIYNARGCLGDEAWKKFAKFCEDNDFTYEPTMGRRIDGTDNWDRFQFDLAHKLLCKELDEIRTEVGRLKN